MLTNARNQFKVPKRGNFSGVDGGGQKLFGFAKLHQEHLWVRYLVHDRVFWGLLMSKFDFVRAKLGFSQK